MTLPFVLDERGAPAVDALAHLENFLERAHPGFAEDRKLHDEARRISESYTTSTAGGAAAPDAPRSIAPDAAASIAYLAHFGPRAIAAVRHALTSSLVAADASRARKAFSAVDLGAGSGASALALVEAGAAKLTLVDSSAASLALARRLLEGARVRGAPVDVRTITAKLGSAPVNVGDADLALSAFAFGELNENEPRAAFAHIERAAPKAREFVVVDAGDRARSRRIQHLRDALVIDEKRAVTAPCPHVDACPALVRERDWCHARIPKQLPEKLAAFARAVGRDDETMALSYVVVSAPGVAQTNDNERGALLVIGEPLKEKGRARLPVCGPGGVRFVMALKRNREAHDALLDVERGVRLPLTAARDAQAGTAHIEKREDLER